MSSPSLSELEKVLFHLINKFKLKSTSIIQELFHRLPIDEDMYIQKWEPTAKTQNLSNYQINLQDLIDEKEEEVVQIQRQEKKINQELAKPTPTRYEVEGEFTKWLEQNELALSNDIYDRYGGADRKCRGNVFKCGENYPKEIQEFIDRAQIWRKMPNVEHRIISMKLAPRFRSNEEEARYYEKRVKASSFCMRGFGLTRPPETYFQDPSPPYPQKRKYKTVCTSFVAESYRKFEQIFSHQMRKNFRRVSGNELKLLHHVLINSQSYFATNQFHCFRKCCKVAFQLGSVTISQHEAIDFFIAVYSYLRDRYPEFSKTQEDYQFDDSFESTLLERSRPLDFYAPKREGGYQELEDKEMTVNEQDFDLELEYSEIA